MPHLLHTSSLIAMRKRREFLMVRDRGVKQVTPFFILQACRARDDGPPHFGITASKKTGNAVRRNRARRRMRALLRKIVLPDALHGYDYSLVARYNLADAPWDALCDEMRRALVKLHKKIERAGGS